MEQNHSLQADSLSADQNIPAFCETRRSITVSTNSAICPYLSQINPDHDLHPMSFESILITLK
jgi:superfamily I DNA and RNA helicase